jgi:uncharacterized protein involved in exopolysaccharide biosynthesis
VAHYNILKSDVDTNRQLYDSMLQNVQEAGMTSALRASNIRVVDSAVPPTRPYKPSVVLNSALGLLAGALFGFVFVVMRERADRSIQAPGESCVIPWRSGTGRDPFPGCGTQPLLCLLPKRKAKQRP